ncbi:MAG TPA: hypothetical protein PK747_09980 [Acidobacteriota bacterium]|nr:hypothetical protein [Acidobacteriota bacterium]HQQ47717.1 hypothetical protein [Acidobacteriota bacterium]
MTKNSLMRIVGIFIILSLTSIICFGETDEPGTLNINMASPGFSPSMTYQNFGNGESVNTASGGLTVVHNSSLSLPQNMGASLNFTRVYNSKSSKDAYKDYGYALDEVYPNWGFLGPGWKLSFGRVFLRIIRNNSLTEPKNVSVYFYEDESGTEYRLFPATDDTTNADAKRFENNWDYATLPVNKYPYDDKYYRTEDGSFIYAKFTIGADNDITKSYWTIFLPDGTKKVCGSSDPDKPAFILPLRSQNDGCLDGIQYCPFCRNEEINGWYCTEVKDRANNAIQIEYRQYDHLSQPYAGSISKIIDQSGRETIFETYPAGSALTAGAYGKDNLLEWIQYPDGKKDVFDYSEIPQPYIYGIDSVMLEKVEDPTGLEILYSYQAYGVDVHLSRAYLKKIYYPTGGVSEFSYEHIEEITTNQNGNTSVRPKADVVKEKKLYSGANTLSWSWDRTSYQNTIGPHLEGESLFDVGFPVVITDPYGVQEVHCFKGNGIDDSGAEYYVVRIKPKLGLTSDLITYPENSDGTPKNGIVMIQKKYWRSLDGHPKDGIFLKKIVEKDASHDNNNPITHTTQRGAYDGWGHLEKTVTYQGEGSTPADPLKKSISSHYLDMKPDYSSVTEDLSYDLTRVSISYSGGTGAYVGKTYSYNGKLLQEAKDYYTIQTSIPGDSSFAIADSPISLSQPSGDFRSVVLAYDNNGNVSGITYGNSNGTGNPYSQYLTWQYGVVTSMRWEGFSYNEFTRTLDTDNSRIHTETDPNGIMTTFDYDAVGRITSIQPGGNEVATIVSYPPDEYGTTKDGVNWQTGHVIKCYRGTGGMPSATPGTGDVSSLPEKDTYTYYEFDDLGRLWRTSTVMPDNTWSCTEKHYDPLGNVCFESLPFKAGTLSSSSVEFPVATGSSYSIILPQSNSKHYGAWTTPFSDGTFDSPLTGDLDPFYRTRWILKPDGGKTGTDYVGLETRVTIFDIQTGPRPIDKTNSTTKYYKDIFGRLFQVDAPEGADAVYTYNGLDQMIKAVIGTNQTRDFTYNALGQLLQSKTPERGTINYLGYDARGNLLKMSDGLAGGNYTLDYIYDSKGRATRLKKSTSACPLKSWEYDNNSFFGRVSKAVSYGTSFGECYTSNIEEYFYENGTGRLSQKNVSDMGKTFTVTYDYDDYGMVESETRSLGQGFSTINYGYLHGRLDSALFSDSQRGAHKINYHPSGGIREICISGGCGKKISYGEEASTGRLSNINYIASEEYVWTTGNYSYDGAGNITGIGDNNKYYHDSLSRLTIADVENPQGTDTTQTYDFK